MTSRIGDNRIARRFRKRYRQFIIVVVLNCVALVSNSRSNSGRVNEERTQADATQLATELVNLVLLVEKLVSRWSSSSHKLLNGKGTRTRPQRKNDPWKKYTLTKYISISNLQDYIPKVWYYLYNKLPHKLEEGPVSLRYLGQLQCNILSWEMTLLTAVTRETRAVKAKARVNRMMMMK